jgi:NADP-dependent 3-hydroxy acid dehydrogenase YdfG
MRNDFEEITRELTAVEPSGDEGSVQATTNAMTDIKASEIAEKIVSIYDQITRMDAVETGVF